MTGNSKYLEIGWLPSSTIFALVALLTFLPSVSAQQKFQFVRQAPKKKYVNDNEFVPENLKQPPDLPFLPPYSGQGQPKYDNLLVFKKKRNGPGYTETFHVKEYPQQVMSFYKNAFKENRWVLDKNAETGNMVGATRRGAVCTVTVMKPIFKGYNTQVYLIYKISGNVQ